MSQPTEDADPMTWIKWCLECKCCPMVEHCDQCDGRRKVYSRVEMKQERVRLTKKLAEIDAKLAEPLHGTGPVKP